MLATLPVPARGREAVGVRRPRLPMTLVLPGRRAESRWAGRAAGVKPGGPITGLGALRGADAVELLRAFDALEGCAFLEAFEAPDALEAADALGLLADDFLAVLAADGFFEDFERSVMPRALTSLFGIFEGLPLQKSLFTVIRGDMLQRKLSDPVDRPVSVKLRDRG
jgi:hypothetical protein